MLTTKALFHHTRKKYINSIRFIWAQKISFDFTNLTAHPGSRSCCMISFELSFWSKILFSDILQFLPLSKILCCWLYEQRAVCAKLTYLRPYIDKSFIFINLSITSQQLEIFVPARGLIARNARVTRILQRFFSQCYKWELQRFSRLAIEDLIWFKSWDAMDTAEVALMEISNWLLWIEVIHKW